MNTLKHLEVIEYTGVSANNSKIEKVAIYNPTIVGAAEVRGWVEKNLLDVESKHGVITMTKERYVNLFGEFESEHVKSNDSNDSDMFYDDLLMEQREQM